MSAKPTPGPWEYSGGGIWGNSPFNARVRLADITFHNSINDISSVANGRLMTAAPELLAALTTIDALYSHWWDSADDSGAIILMPPSVEKLEAAHAAAVAAIARATGSEGGA